MTDPQQRADDLCIDDALDLLDLVGDEDYRALAKAADEIRIVSKLQRGAYLRTSRGQAYAIDEPAYEGVIIRRIGYKMPDGSLEYEVRRVPDPVPDAVAAIERILAKYGLRFERAPNDSASVGYAVGINGSRIPV